MRNIVIAAMAALALSACATNNDRVQRQAAFNCQAVGISQNDPQFATCTKAYSRAYIEDRLDQSYHDALNAVPMDRRIRQPVY